MKKILFYVLTMFFSASLLAQTVDVTMSVDMSQYAGTFTTTYVFGSFNGWNTTANPLTDQGNGIWQGTITVNANDSIEYKFVADGVQENFAVGEPCTKTTGGFTNRFLAYGNTNTTVPTVCWESCAACGTPPATVDITFLVNTASITVDPTGLYLAGGASFGIPGDNPMTDANNDGVWEITVTRNQGISGYYIFTNGNSGWGAKENLAGLPCGDPNNFNDRTLPVIWGDTTIMTCYETCATDTVCPAPPTTVDLTLSVDLSQYTGSFTTAYISGSFNGWNGTSNPLADQGNGIWQGTITVPMNDSIEYKFTLDNWNAQEGFAGGESCTKTTGGNINRFLAYGSSNTTVPTVCWESCAACVVAPTTVDVTMSVDMSQYTGTFTTAYVFGSFNGWNTTANPLTDQGNGIWQGTITVPANDSIEYKFVADGVQENFAGGELCTKTTGAFTNRFLAYGSSNTTMPTVCWESCAACVVAPTTVDVTMSVDMSQYAGTFTTAYVFGSFNGWNTTANPLTDQGNGIWQGTITVPANDSIEYKFVADGVQENFAGGEPCTKTTGGFTNRFLAYGSSNTTMPTVCWESCAACGTPPATVDITFLVNTASITVDPTGLYLAGGASFGIPGDNPMTDANNDGVWEITVTRNQGISGYYIFTNGNSGWGAKENLAGLPCGDPNNFNDRTLPVIWGDTTIMTCYETCATDTVCPAPPTTVDLTLSVDLSQYTGSFTTAYISGSFNGWNGTSNPLADQGNGIWQGTITVPMNDSIEYKFTLDDWNAQEGFAGGESCTKTTGGNINRFLAYGNMNMTIPTVCWESCAACVLPQGASAYCNTQVYHFGNVADTASSVFMTITNISSTEMKVEVESASWDPVDLMIVNGGSGAAISAENTSIPGKISRTLTWVTPPTNVDLNVLWSKNTFGGNWQLNPTDITVPFADTCANSVQPPANTVDITFLVNTANITVDPTGIYLAGGASFGIPGDNPLTDANNDGVWEITVTRNQGISGNYIFTNGNSGWGAKEILTGLPCADPANFDDRILPVIWNDTTIMTCYGTCSSDTTCPAPPTTVDLTVAVDMSQYTGSTANGVFINGSFNGWNGTSNPLTDQGNGLWTGTITVPENDSIEYKFTVDGWIDQEVFAGGEPCTKTTGTNINRFLAYGNMNMALDTVCWNSCTACPASPPPTVDITFLVNTANITVDPTGIYLAGGTSFGMPGDNPMTDTNGDGVWEITVTRNQGIAGHYIFTNGNSGWGAKEILTGLPCADPANFDDRILPVIWSDTTIMTCYETCAADTVCPAPATTIDLTLSVDMSQYTGSTANGVFINGSFNGWNGTSNPLTDQGNGIWQGTITVPENDSIEYKFTVDGWTDQEMFNGGEPCTKTTGQNTNRFVAYGNTNTTVPTVCWNLCTACPTAADSVDVTFVVDMRLVDTIAPSGVFLGANFDNWTGSIPMTDVNNDSIYEVTVNLLGNTSYEFKFINGVNWASQEDFDPTTADSTCTITTGTFTNRILNVGTADTSTMAYCYDECFECVIDNTKPVRLTTAFTMMPNPANAYVRLMFDNEFIAMEKRIFLHNSVGQVILNESIDNMQSYDINTSNMPAGMYYITIQTDEGVQTKRLVINH